MLREVAAWLARWACDTFERCGVVRGSGRLGGASCRRAWCAARRRTRAGAGGGGSAGGGGGIADAATDAPVGVCDPTEKPLAGIFVSPTGSGTGSGSQALPITSINAALAIAAGSGQPKTVYLDQGTYAEEV